MPSLEGGVCVGSESPGGEGFGYASFGSVDVPAEDEVVSPVGGSREELLPRPLTLALLSTTARVPSVLSPVVMPTITPPTLILNRLDTALLLTRSRRPFTPKLLTAEGTLSNTEGQLADLLGVQTSLFPTMLLRGQMCWPCLR